MRRIAVVCVLVLITASAYGQCKDQVQVQPKGNITVTLCDPTTITAGAKFTIDVGGVSIPVEAVSAVSLGPNLPTIVETNPIDASKPEVVLLAQGAKEVTIKVGAKSIKANVRAESVFSKYRRYNWAVGPVQTGDKSSSAASLSVAAATNDTSAKDAFRLQYADEYAYGRQVGTGTAGFQTFATLDLDTTNKHDPSFVDNNRATFGGQFMQLSLGDYLKQGRVGVEVRASKAAHQDIHDFDGAVKVAAWLPFIPALNFMNSSDFIASPLLFSASYGYRNRDQNKEKFHGRIFEGTASYHVFAIDRVSVYLKGTWTVNQLSNRSSTTPRTQRMYKATISYLQDAEKGFSVLTTIEDGSAGVMLTKVRQYFVGVALSKINFSGGSK